MTAITPDSDSLAFESAVKQHFGFLDGEDDFRFAGVREVNDGPRDTGVVARYRHGDVRIEIGWSANEGSLAVLIRTDIEGISRKERYAYLEPFVEFASNGSMEPVVPQIYPGMSVAKIETAMKLRSVLFQHGVAEALGAVALRLQEFYPSIRDASAETIRQYHQWYQNRGRTS